MANYQWNFIAGGTNQATAMAAALTRLERIADTLVLAERRLAAVQNTVADGFTRLNATVSSSNRTVDASTTIINNFGRQTQGTSRHVETLFQKMMKAAHVWNTFNAAISFAKTRLHELGGAIGSVMSVGMGFESQEASLKGLLDNYQPVIDKAKELGATTKFSAEESAAGAVELAKAGLDATQIIDSLSPTLQAAEANSITVGQAGKIAAVGMNQFARSGESATEILQIYTAAANSSSTDILPLSAAMKNAAGTASLLGLDAKKTATFLALMGSKGLEAGAAGTQFKIAIQNLTAVTPRAQKALATLGINVKSLDLTDPVSWLDVFSEKLKKIPSDAEKIALLKPIFGEAVTGMMPIIIEGGEAWKKMYDQIDAGAGKMAEMQKAKAATVGGAWEGMKSAAEGVALGIYDLLKVPIVQWFNTWQTALGELGTRLNEIAKRFTSSKGGIEAWIATMRSEGLSGLFQDILNDLEPQIDQLKQIATAAWETVKAVIQEGIKAIFTPDVKDLLVRQAVSIFETAWGAILKIPKIQSVSNAIDTTTNTVKNVAEAEKVTFGSIVTPFTSAYRGAKTALEYRGNNAAWEQQGQMQLDFLGKLELKKREIQRIPVTDQTEADKKRLENINAQILTTEANIRQLAEEYKNAGRADLVNGALGTVAGRTATQVVGASQKIDPMRYEERKAIKNKALEIEAGGTYQPPSIKSIQETGQAPYKGKMTEQEAAETRIQQLIQKGFSEKQARMVVGQQRAEESTTRRDTEKQAASAKAQQALDQAKMLEETKKRQAEEERAMQKEAIEAAQKQLAFEKERLETKKKMQETEAAIANAPLDLKMQQNETNTGFAKWLLEPINKFQEAISGVIGKFMGVFENLGNKRVEAGRKSGRLDDAGAKQESVAVLEGSVARAQKMLQLAQTPGQKAEALQTQAEKLLEISDLTGDKSKAAKADELLKRAQTEQGKQEDIEIQKIELDRKLAQDNVKLLAQKKDGSASEGVVRLQQLMASYQELGDVRGAMDAKRQLEAMQRQAAGEQVGVLKMILQELQLSRKGSDLQMQEQNAILKAGNEKQVNALNGMQNAAPAFDPMMAAPAY